MQLRSLGTLIILSLGVISVAPIAKAQQAQPTYPLYRDLLEDQRKMDHAKLDNAEVYFKRCKERLGEGQLRLAQQSGLWTLELMASAKELMRPHPDKIEEARNAMGFRVNESTRKELRESYSKIQDKYFNLEERLENVASVLASKGYPVLKNALSAIKSSTSSAETDKALQKAFKEAGESRREQIPGTPAGGSSSGGGQAPEQTGATAVQSSPNSVTVTAPNGKQVQIPGTLDGNVIHNPEVGDIDLSSLVTTPNGTQLYQTNKGVYVLLPDGSRRFLAGAKLNPDGTITLADGRVLDGNTLKPTANGGLAGTGTDGNAINIKNATPGGGSSGGSMGGSNESNGGYNSSNASNGQTNNNMSGDQSGNSGGSSGRPFASGDALKGNKALIGLDGNPVTSDPSWPPFNQNGERTGVKRTYIGGIDRLLTKEVQVNQKVVEVAADSSWKVKETLGESRSWDLEIREAGTAKQGAGSLEVVFELKDNGDRTDFTVKSWSAQDANGSRASVDDVAGAPSKKKISFSKSGNYKVTVEGQTEWGSKFSADVNYTVGIE